MTAQRSSYAMLAILVILSMAAMTALNPRFLLPGNLLAMTTFGVEIGLMTLGEAMVILGGGGGIDLSVGAIYALSEVIIGVLVRSGVGVFLAVGCGLAAGILMGMFNGTVITRLRIPAIITTLATMYAFYGIALLLTGGIDISPFPKSYYFLGQATVAGIPFQLLAVYVPAVLAVAYVVGRTRYGRNLYYVGTNELAAWLSGISVPRTRWWTYVVTGGLSAVAGVINSSRLITARPDAGQTANLEAITIAVLGGVSIFGGRGSVAGVVLATLVITVLRYGLSLANVNSVWQTGVVGMILILSVLGQTLGVPWRRRRAQEVARG